MLGLAVMTHNPVTRTDQGGGKYLETLGVSTTIYGVIRVHDTPVTMTVAKETVIANGAQITANGEQYRVLGRLGPVDGPKETYTLEKVFQPITPAG